MRARSWSLTVLLAALLVGPAVLLGCSTPQESPETAQAAPSVPPAERGGQDEFGPYEVVANWPLPPPDGDDGVTHAEGWTWGSSGAIFAESPDRIWIAMRGELPLPAGVAPWTPYGALTPPRQSTGNDDAMSATCGPAEKRGWERRYHHVIWVVDGEGRQVDYWQQHDKLFQMPCGRGPHRIKMNPYDPDKHVWVIDDQLHVIHKFTYGGDLVMTLGTKGQRGRDGGRLFDRPTDIDWLPDGTFFISDGYGGTRVAKFDRDGKFLMDWGSAPKDPANPGPNEWNTVHSLAISDDRRVFVVDRAHHRFQIFDENGTFLDMFSTGVNSLPYYHFISTDGYLWVADGGTQRILKYDLDGNYLYGWGIRGGAPGQLWGPHQITTDQEGNLYLAEVFNGRNVKFRPRPGAVPARLVGQEKRYSASAQ